MAVLLKQGLSYQHLDTYQSDLHEVIWLFLHCEDHSRIVVGAIYRPGSASEYDITLLNYLDNAIDRVRGLVPTFCWLGTLTSTTQIGLAAQKQLMPVRSWKRSVLGTTLHDTSTLPPAARTNLTSLFLTFLVLSRSQRFPRWGGLITVLLLPTSKRPHPYANFPPRDKCGDMLRLIGTGCEPTFAVLTGQPSPATVQSSAVWISRRPS